MCNMIFFVITWNDRCIYIHIHWKWDMQIRIYYVSVYMIYIYMFQYLYKYIICLYIHQCKYIYIYKYIDIYIHQCKETKETYIYLYGYTCIYIYVYIYHVYPHDTVHQTHGWGQGIETSERQGYPKWWFVDLAFLWSCHGNHLSIYLPKSILSLIYIYICIIYLWIYKFLNPCIYTSIYPIYIYWGSKVNGNWW